MLMFRLRTPVTNTTSQVTTVSQNNSTPLFKTRSQSSYNFFHKTSMVDRAIRTGKCTSCGGLHR